MLRLAPGSKGDSMPSMTASGRAAGGEVAGFGVLVGVEFPPCMMEGSKESLGVVDLNLAAAQGYRQVVLELVESRLIVAGTDDEEVGVGAVLQGIGAGDSDAQSRENRFGG